MACELHGEVAREPAGILDQDDADVMSLAIGKQGRETGSSVDRVGTGNRSIIEGLDQPMAAFGVGLDGFRLAPTLGVSER